MHRWIICPTCRGDGAHSHAMGSISPEQFEQEGDDFRSAYFSGRYDSPCEPCNGSGKLLANQNNEATA